MVYVLADKEYAPLWIEPNWFTRWKRVTYYIP